MSRSGQVGVRTSCCGNAGESSTGAQRSGTSVGSFDMELNALCDTRSRATSCSSCVGRQLSHSAFCTRSTPFAGSRAGGSTSFARGGLRASLSWCPICDLHLHSDYTLHHLRPGHLRDPLDPVQSVDIVERLDLQDLLCPVDPLIGAQRPLLDHLSTPLLCRRLERLAEELTMNSLQVTR